MISTNPRISWNPILPTSEPALVLRLLAFCSQPPPPRGLAPPIRGWQPPPRQRLATSWTEGQACLPDHPQESAHHNGRTHMGTLELTPQSRKSQNTVFVKPPFQTRHGGAERINKRENFFNAFLQIRIPKSTMTDPISLKICLFIPPCDNFE